MNDTVRVDGFQGVEDLPDHVHCFRDIFVAAVDGQTVGERLAIDVGHDHVGPAVVFADIVNRADVGMPDLSGGAGLALEALQADGPIALRHIEARQLERDDPV